MPGRDDSARAAAKKAIARALALRAQAQPSRAPQLLTDRTSAHRSVSKIERVSKTVVSEQIASTRRPIAMKGNGTRNANNCGLLCGVPAVTSICGTKLCQKCLDTIRAIAVDAGVSIDEQLLGGELRMLNRSQLNRDEKKAARRLERREIDEARRSA